MGLVITHTLTRKAIEKGHDNHIRPMAYAPEALERLQYAKLRILSPEPEGRCGAVIMPIGSVLPRYTALSYAASASITTQSSIFSARGSPSLYTELKWQDIR